MTDRKILYNFLIDCKDEELPYYRSVTDFSSRDMERTDLGWCLQTHAHLSASGHLRVACSNRLLKNAINIVHSAQLLHLGNTRNHFVVCVRADFPKRRWAQYHLVQNAKQLQKHTSLLPLWIQPGLVPRDASRQTVDTVAYTGVPYNGNMAEPVGGWPAFFGPYGIKFIQLSTGAWNDLSDVDVMVGIRRFGNKTFDNKPPSKLLNAWHAGIPFIGGTDSAYQQMGDPGKDYLIARSADDVLQAVLRLRSDPDFYQMLVSNGKKKARECTAERIAAMWEDVLSGPVLNRYQQWRKHRNYEAVRTDFFYRLAIVNEKMKSWLREKNWDPVRMSQLSANRKVDNNARQFH